MKREALRHPKLHGLCGRLNCSRTQGIGILTLLWDFASDHAPRGDIGKWDDETIARACDWTDCAAEFIEALVSAGWVDRDDEHRIVIHDWQDHCENWVRSKVARMGVEFVGQCRLKTPLKSPLKSTSEASPIPSHPTPSHPIQTKPTPSMPETNGNGVSKKPDGDGGWDGGGLAPDEFKALDAAVPRFREAVSCGWVRDSEVSRLRFFRTWIYVGRQAKRTDKNRVRSPGALFTKIIQGKDTPGNQADEDAARMFLKQLEKPP